MKLYSQFLIFHFLYSTKESWDHALKFARISRSKLIFRHFYVEKVGKKKLQSCQGKLNKISFLTFFLVCRAVTIFLLTQRAMLGGPFRYLEHIRKANRKFSRDLWRKVSAQKTKVLSEYSNLILSFIFSKSQLFSLFLPYNPIGVSCGHDFFTDAKS